MLAKWFKLAPPSITSRSIKEKLPPGQTVKILVSVLFDSESIITMKPLIAILALFPVAFVMAEDARSAEIRLTETMDELNRRDTIKIYGDMITLEKVEFAEDEETAGRASQDPLVSKIEEFLRSRRIHVRLPSDGSSVDMFGRALGQKDVAIELRSLTTGASEGKIYIGGIKSGNF